MHHLSLILASSSMHPSLYFVLFHKWPQALLRLRTSTMEVCCQARSANAWFVALEVSVSRSPVPLLFFVQRPGHTAKVAMMGWCQPAAGMKGCVRHHPHFDQLIQKVWVLVNFGNNNSWEKCVCTFRVGPRPKSLKVSDPIGQEKNSGPKNYALGMPKTTKK